MPSTPRDAAVSDRKGTAVIKGRVRSTDGRPLRRAAVSVRGAGLPNARIASTGLDGEYELGELPAGRYTVAATRGGYLRSEYGQRYSGEQGTPVEVAEGATLEKIDLTMERAGVVSGRVSDEAGEGVANAQVWLQQMRFYEGRRKLVPLASARTDDTGLYRIASIAPGEYLVVAYFRETWASDDNKETLGYAPSYYPGTANPGEAQRIKVVAGQEAAAIDVVLVPGRAAAVSGTVIAADGTPLAGASVGLAQEIAGPGGASMSMIGNARAAADGAFVLRSIPPGEYQLRATGTAGDRAESASTTVLLTGRDLDGIVLGGNRGGLVTGRIVTDTGGPLPAGALRVMTTSAAFARSTTQTPPIEDGAPGADGRFTRRAPAGAAFIRPSGQPAGWALKQVIVGGRDHTDTPVEIHPEQTLGDVTVVISNRLPPVTGRVTDPGDAGGPVLLVPADPARWLEASGALRSARPDHSGRFRFEHVRPGEYLAVAVERMEAWQLNDPEFLHSVREKATRISVAEEPVSVDLRVVR
jgi:protocatechuate 3,4-dioxygenase beta subunit